MIYDIIYKILYKEIAYGTIETSRERLDVAKLITNKDKLVKWIDTKFTSKEDFTEMLKKMKIIYEV